MSAVSTSSTLNCRSKPSSIRTIPYMRAGFMSEKMTTPNLDGYFLGGVSLTRLHEGEKFKL